MNRTDNQLLLRSLQPIQTPLQPIYTIYLDFVIAFPTVLSKDTLWAIEGFNTFNNLLTTICKSSKKKLLILRNERYIIEDWNYVFGKQLLLNDWGCPKAMILDRDPKFTSNF